MSRSVAPTTYSLVAEYDRERGISYWAAHDGRYAFYDPIPTLPPSGVAWWSAHPNGEPTNVQV